MICSAGPTARRSPPTIAAPLTIFAPKTFLATFLVSKMHSANGEKIEAPENPTPPPTTATPRDPEKQSLTVEDVNSQPGNMPRIQHFFFTLLILALLGLTIVSAASNRALRNGVVAEAFAQEKLRFQELLNSVEPSSLHDVLHQHMKDKYKHGVYQEDKHAMEVVHQENAEVAHSLIELAKRDTTNGSTTAIVTTTAATTTETTTKEGGTQTETGAATTTSESSQPSTTQQSSQSASTTQQSLTDTRVKQTTSAPSSAQSTVSTLPVSTNGTFLSGPAAYPFAPPPSPPSSSAYYPIQNYSISVPAAPSSSAPSVSGYEFVQSSSSSSAVSTCYVQTSSSIVPTSSAAPTSYFLNSSSISLASSSAATTSCILNSSSIASPFTLISAPPPYPLSSNCSTSSPSGSVFNATSGSSPPVSSPSSGPPSTSSASPSPSPSSSSASQGHTSSPSSTPSARQTSSNTATGKSSSSGKADTSATPSRSVTQQILYTTTLPNGGVSTVTSVTVVPADQAQTVGESGGTSTNTGTASLQTNSATPGRILGISGVLGALGLVVVVGGL